MPRSLLTPLILAAALAGLVAYGRGLGAAAEDGSVPAAATHPIVGSWQVPGDPNFLYSFAQGGAVVATDEGGTTWHGEWRPLGSDRVDYALWHLTPIRDGTSAQGFQATLRIDADRGLVRDGRDVRWSPLDPAGPDTGTATP